MPAISRARVQIDIIDSIKRIEVIAFRRGNEWEIRNDKYDETLEFLSQYTGADLRDLSPETAR